MAEFIIKVADERGRVQEQVQTAATAEELRIVQFIVRANPDLFPTAR
jgi:hypothetical protein